LLNELVIGLRLLIWARLGVPEVLQSRCGFARASTTARQSRFSKLAAEAELFNNTHAVQVCTALVVCFKLFQAVDPLVGSNH